jgi:hypothetical protein
MEFLYPVASQTLPLGLPIPYASTTHRTSVFNRFGATLPREIEENQRTGIAPFDALVAWYHGDSRNNL